MHENIAVVHRSQTTDEERLEDAKKKWKVYWKSRRRRRWTRAKGQPKLIDEYNILISNAFSVMRNSLKQQIPKYH